MKQFFPHKLWITFLSVLALSVLSACGNLQLQIITATPVPVTFPANTATPETPVPTQLPTQNLTPTSEATLTDTVTPTTSSGPAGPTGPVTIESIKMKDASTGWAIGKLIGGTSDLILTTQDGAKTWKNVTPAHAFDVIGPDNKSAIADFSSSGNAWVFFFNKDQTPPGPASVVIWSTTDSGGTWKASQALDIANIQMAFFKPSDISFADAQHGWVLIHLDAGMMHDYITIFATADGGSSWKEVVDPSGPAQTLPQSCYKSGMVFLDASTGWVAGDCGGVQAGVYFYKTTDGGLTWAIQTLPGPAAAANAFTDQNNACGSFPPQFIDAKTGFISVKCANLSGSTPITTTWPYVTHDGGASWTALPPLAEPVGTFFFLNGQTGWFLGDSSTDASLATHTIYQTLDGGKSWKALIKPSWDGQMDFITPQAGWVVASDGNNLALVQTSDGGLTWTQI